MYQTPYPRFVGTAAIVVAFALGVAFVASVLAAEDESVAVAVAVAAVVVAIVANASVASRLLLSVAAIALPMAGQWQVRLAGRTRQLCPS